MPLRPENSRTFHRTLYAGWNETITLYKREDGTWQAILSGPQLLSGEKQYVNRRSIVTPYVLYDILPDDIHKTGEPLETQSTTSHRRTFQIPRIELERNGIWVINALDMINDKEGRWWQPESTTNILNKLGQQYIDVDCLLTDPLVGTSIQG